MTAQVKIIAHSISPTGQEIVTFQLRYWRAIHAELMTHRVFSRNASSSRAIPVATVLKQVWNDPAGPIHWGANQAGMQAKQEVSGWRRSAARLAWKLSAKAASAFAYLMMKIGLHKQVANRILEPFQYISVVLTTTELDNWFELRDHPDAQPEIHELAGLMKEELVKSSPRRLGMSEWHLPYITNEELETFDIVDLLKMSCARCARVSYLTHDGKVPNFRKDFELFDRLVGSRPLHASPTEHQATPSGDNQFHKNFRGWVQFRKFVEATAFSGFELKIN